MALVGTKWSNEIIGDEQDNLLSTSLLPGDEENNRLWHRTGQDTLRGNGGSDSYYIGRGARNICINNQDVSSVKGGKIAIDNVIVPWLINQIALSDDGDDVDILPALWLHQPLCGKGEASKHLTHSGHSRFKRSYPDSRSSPP